MNQYILTGRVCDKEDHVKMVIAQTETEAKTTFESAIRAIEDDMESDFHIEFCQTVSQMRNSAIKGASNKEDTLKQDAFYLASGLFIKENCFDDNDTLRKISESKCESYESDSDADVYQNIFDTADALITFHQAQIASMSKADVISIVKDVVQQSDGLALDDKEDREVLINHLISKLDTAQENEQEHNVIIKQNADKGWFDVLLSDKARINVYLVEEDYIDNANLEIDGVKCIAWHGVSEIDTDGVNTVLETYTDTHH
ncbi:MAG: hypothetical protein P8I03_02780 [Thalassotalea sp.]|nr:hypothetical protein [Thalassotalea sp.]